MAASKITPEISHQLSSPARYKTVTLDAKIRRKINGETESQMKHVEQKKKEMPDTTVDSIWEIDSSLSSLDSVVLGYSKMYLIPKMILFFIPIFVLMIPFSLITNLYAMILPLPTDRLKRNTCGFLFYCTIATISLIPSLILIALTRSLDFIYYYLFNIPYCCFSKNGWKRYSKNMKIIKPYNNGPSIKLIDVYVCAIGQILRNGFIEFAISFTIMVLAIPWLKYFINCNPYIYNLDERFIQQISTTLEDCGIEKVSDNVKKIISRTKQDSKLQKRLDLWEFVPHYPYPPLHRRWAIGMQSASSLVTLLTHTTHADAIALNSTEHFIFSNSVEKPIWRVMLWYNNPYHFLTGFVEASISNGKPSQLDKKYGGEHPMWLITGHSTMLSDRLLSTVPNPTKIDMFFDKWLPVIVDEVRALIRGPEIAKQLHQEVISKEGISRPAAMIGVPPNPPASNPRIHEN